MEPPWIKSGEPIKSQNGNCNLLSDIAAPWEFRRKVVISPDLQPRLARLGVPRGQIVTLYYKLARPLGEV
jgi:hypothetical protein